MKIIKVEPLSVGIRIKNEIKEKSISNKKFVEQINAWLEKQRKEGKYREQPDILEGHLSRWLRENNPVQMRDDKIAMFADFLNVDVDYLKCKQVEKHKPDFSDFDKMVDMDRIRKYRSWLKLLESIGYRLNTYGVDLNTEEFQFIDNGYLYTAINPISKNIEEVIVDPDGKTYIFEYHIINELDDFVRFKVSQLKPYDNNSSGS